MAVTQTVRTRQPVARMIGIGAIAGLVGAIAMAMYAMIAGATYQSRGYEGTSPWISELPSASWRRHS